MKKYSLIRWQAIAPAMLGTCFASLAFSAPASAVRVPPPGDAATATASSPAPSSPGSSGPVWDQLALGAGGGVALVAAGAGVVVAGRRHRASHTAHPA